MSTSNTPRPLPPPGATDMQHPHLYRFYLFARTVQACLRTPTWANIQVDSKGAKTRESKRGGGARLHQGDCLSCTAANVW